METDIDSFLEVFDTSDTHHVFNNKKYLITLKMTHQIPVKMANGSTTSYITGIGNVAICNPSMQYKTKILKQVFLYETLRHSLVAGIALAEAGESFFQTKMMWIWFPLMVKKSRRIGIVEIGFFKLSCWRSPLRQSLATTCCGIDNWDTQTSQF